MIILPIDVTLVGMTTDVSPVLWKARSPILVMIVMMTKKKKKIMMVIFTDGNNASRNSHRC